MSRTLGFHEAAEVELNEAADFYDIESPGLGNAFIDESESALGAIAQSVAHQHRRPFYWRGRH